MMILSGSWFLSGNVQGQTTIGISTYAKPTTGLCNTATAARTFFRPGEKIIAKIKVANNIDLQDFHLLMGFNGDLLEYNNNVCYVNTTRAPASNEFAHIFDLPANCSPSSPAASEAVRFISISGGSGGNVVLKCTSGECTLYAVEYTAKTLEGADHFCFHIIASSPIIPANAIAFETTTVTIDGTKPEVSVIAHVGNEFIGDLNGRYFNSSLRIFIQATDTNLLANDTGVTLNNVVPTLANITQTANSYKAETEVTAEKKDHVILVQGKDAAGNTTIVNATFTIDKTKPVINVFGVTNNQLTNANVTPVFMVTDTNPDPSKNIATLNSAPYMLGTTIAATGTHLLIFTATDKAGNTDSTSITFTIDKTPPDISITGVSDNLFTSAQFITPFIDVTDNLPNNIQSTIIQLNGQAFISETAIVEERSHTLFVASTDKAGNTATKTFHFTIDRTPPVITVTGIEDNQVANADIKPVISSSDPNFDHEVITLDGDPFVSGRLISTTVTRTYQLIVKAYDKAGNEAITTINFTIDVNRPRIDITNVENGLITNNNIIPNIVISGHTLQDPPIILLISSSESKDYVCDSISHDCEPITGEGSYSIIIVASNGAGNSRVTIRFTIDKTKPIINITGVSNNQITNADVTPVVTVTDANPGTIIGTLDDGSELYTLGTPISSTGTHQLIFTATDLAGNTNTASITFKIDKTPPGITIAGVINNQITNTNVSPIVTVTEANFSSLTTTLNTIPFSLGTPTASTGDTKTYTLSPPISSTGTHQLIFTATDLAGNTNSTTINFTIDKSPPDITVSGVTGNLITNANVIPIVTVTDAHFDHLQVFLDNANYILGAPTSSTGASITYTLDPPISSTGMHQLIFTATDLAGNTNSTSINFTIDKAPPIITVTGVSDNLITNADVTPAIHVTDDNPDTVTATLDSVVYALGSPIATTGNHQLNITATDLAGNISTISIEFIIDKTKPVINVSGVTNNLVTNTEVTPVVTVTDGHFNILHASLDNVVYTLGPPTASSGDSITYTLTPPISATGAHLLIFTATDLAGNTNSTSLNFTIDMTRPKIISITSNESNREFKVGDVLTFNLNFSKAVTSGINSNLVVHFNSGGKTTMPYFSQQSSVGGSYQILLTENSPDLSVTSITLTGSSLPTDVAGNLLDNQVPENQNLGDLADFIVGWQNIYRLKIGWNLISFPGPVNGNSFSQIFQSIPLPSSIWSWDGTRMKDVKSTAAVDKTGYWIYLPTGGNLVLTGSLLSTQTQLSSGWNLIGIDEAELSLIAQSNVLAAWGWDGEYYRRVISLNRYHGYWINAGANGSL